MILKSLFTPRDCKDEVLLARLKKGNERAFEAIYARYWKRTFAFVYNRLQARESSEEIVAGIFLELWHQRRTISIASLPDYLMDKAKRKILEYIEKYRP